jgi:predicted signal transduction protein with EAL and GGDEF domain
MHLTTVAEGIEASEQVAWLASANCAIGQGFLWSKAVPIDEARSMLDQSRWVSTPAAPAPLHAVDVTTARTQSSGPRHAAVVHHASVETARAEDEIAG